MTDVARAKDPMPKPRSLRDTSEDQGEDPKVDRKRPPREGSTTNDGAPPDPIIDPIDKDPGDDND